MKTRSLLAFILILSLLAVPSLQLALAAQSSSTTSTTTTTSTTGPKSPYSERLDIYTAGSNSYWLVSLSPVNATRPAVLAAESVAGMSAYELTAIKTSSATVSSQLFWGDGYRVLKLPFIPQAGVFLNVTATSQSVAQSAASHFDSYLGTSLVQIGSSGNNYTFFSPADFTVAGEVIYTSVPTALKGLASITSAPTLAAAPTPTAILTGVRSGSGFTHSVTFGSVQPSAIGADGTLSFAKATNQANPSFTASPNATSTQLVIHSLDGLISSTDAAAKVTNDPATLSGTYSYLVPSNAKFRPNVTLLQDPPVLTVTRILDRGSASSGDLVSVTIILRNTAQSGTVQNVVMNDTWWTSYPSLLSLNAGNASVRQAALTAGQNVSRVYVLKVISTASQDIILPSEKATYSYSLPGVTVTSSARTNQVELKTNSIGPALMIQTAADIQSGSPIGKTGHYIVTVTNIGNGPALNLQVGNSTNPTLPQGGASWKFNVTLSPTSIISRNLTQVFTVGWTAPDGTKASLLSNPATVLLSHTGILIPLMQFTMSAPLTPNMLKQGTVNATYTLSNTGNAPSGNVTVTQAFAKGMECKKVLNGTATCTTSAFSLNAGPVASGSNVQGKLLMNFSRDNYLTEPGSVTTTVKGGVTLHTTGSAFIVPAGIDATRTDSPNPVFAGQNDTVTVRVVNHGSLPVYNASIRTNPDVFDKALSGTLHQAYLTLGSSATQSFNYTVLAVTPGNHTTAAISVGFAFAGFTAAYTVYPGNVLVHKDVQATTSTKPAAPVEGVNFLLAIDVQNPSSANVTNVSVTVPIPRGLTIVNASSGLQVNGHAVTFTLPSLAPGATSDHLVTLKAGSDANINLGNGSLTFQYQGTTIRGVVVSPPIVVGVDLPLRYELPIGVAILLTIAVAFYMHRKPAVPQTK